MESGAGEIKGFTGIDDPYEAPLNPEMNLATHQLNPQECTIQLLNLLEKAGKIPHLSA